MNMFNVNEYVNELQVDKDDEDLKQVKDLIELKHLIYGDGWTVRQSCYNEAFGMLSHLKYIGGTLLENAERRINTLDRSLISDTFNVSWATKGAVNSDQNREDEEIPDDQQIDDQKTFIDQLKYRMRVCAISYVLHVQEHDDISKDLNQLSFSAIQSRASANRAKRTGTNG